MRQAKIKNIPIKVKLIVLGHLLEPINLSKIKNWRSKLFSISGEIEHLTIDTKTDGYERNFPDEDIREHLSRSDFNENIAIAVTNVSLQGYFITRPIFPNIVVLSFNDVAKMLKDEHIPLESLILRILYSISFLYVGFGNRLPSIFEAMQINHTETRGCLFDICLNRTDIVYSTKKAVICKQCVSKLEGLAMRSSFIETVNKELQGIKKGQYYRIADFVKQQPLLAISISTAIALIVGVVGSLLASWILETAKH